jgi:hypothetical protein
MGELLSIWRILLSLGTEQKSAFAPRRQTSRKITADMSILTQSNLVDEINH